MKKRGKLLENPCLFNLFTKWKNIIKTSNKNIKITEKIK